MRVALFAALAWALCGSNVHAQEPLQILPHSVIDPETECRAALLFLESVPEVDRPYVRLGSYYAVPPKARRDFEIFTRVWWRQLTRQPNRRVVPAPVPGSDSLCWFDLRSFGWNDAAWRAVALRDKTFREPWIQYNTAQRLRWLVGENQPSNFHVLAVVDMWGLFRRTYQTRETADYYDLLFAEERHPLDGKTETRTTLRHFHGDAQYPAGLYKYSVQYPTRKFIDFPKNNVEWVEALSGQKFKDFDGTIKKLKARRGAVCKGMEDANKNASFVARNNRLVWMAPSLSAAFGAPWGETFDQNNSAGERDVEENAFTDQEIDSKRVRRDGGELLFQLPAGDGFATLVVNGQGNRVEEVPPQIAIHTKDPRDRAVRNGSMACMACHAEHYLWIPMKNVIEDTSPAEIDVKFKNNKRAVEDYDAFFIGWQRDLQGIRDGVRQKWEEQTKGWTGLRIGQESLNFKWAYDNPLELDDMVRETGAPVAFLRVAASRSTLRRAVDVARKEPVPRTTWDNDVYPELMKLLSSSKERLYP